MPNAFKNIDIHFLNYLFPPVYLPVEAVLENGCASNDECPEYTACKNRLCVNPCAQKDICANLASCTVYQHEAVCACPDGYIGSPEVDCRPRKYLCVIGPIQHINLKNVYIYIKLIFKNLKNENII